MAPGFFSNIPVLSAIPNPLSLFNLDDSTANNDRSSLDDSDSPESGPSRPKPILSRDSSDPSADSDSEQGHSGRPRATPRKVSAPTSVVIDPGLDSDTPRTGTTRRPRGFSVASRISAVPGDNRKRRIKVETFILVKPPPTSGKNPLNLQVQLVMPDKKPRNRVASDAATRSGDISSVPSTPQRGSFEHPEDAVGQPPEHEPLPPVTELKRSNSITSTHSSSSTTASASSSTAPGKRIVPLYNLAVHNVVQPSVVTDAGTDSKVAKFGKRQLDITGVGILEPAEIWFPYSGLMPGSPRPSVDVSNGHRNNGRPASMISNMSSLTPATSRVDESVRSSMENGKESSLAQEDGAKKFFGKIFRKRGSAEPLSSPRSSNDRRASKMVPSKSSNFLTVDSAAAGSTLTVPSAPSSPQMPAYPNETATPMTPTLSMQVGAPTFGLAPSVVARRTGEMVLYGSGAIIGLTSEAPPPPEGEGEVLHLVRSGRPIGFTWTVRRWAKKNTDGWAAHLVAAAAAGLDLVGGQLPGDGSDEVVFEWVKLRMAPSASMIVKNHPAGDAIEARRRRRRRPARPPGASGSGSPAPSPYGSRTSLPLRPRRKTVVDAPGSTHAGVDGAAAAGNATLNAASAKPASRRAVSPVPRRVSASSDGAELADEASSVADSSSPPTCDVVVDDDDDTYDSDPEDSETPWMFSVWVKRTNRRQLLATLTPTPHHPKVIGVLRIPQSLKSISLAEVPTSAANVNQNSVDMAARICQEVALTEENLKDVVNVTAMWLVAREEFGGLGQKRKGAK